MWCGVLCCAEAFRLESLGLWFPLPQALLFSLGMPGFRNAQIESRSFWSVCRSLLDLCVAVMSSL